MRTLLEMRRVTAGYGGPPVLEDLDLSVASDEIVVVVGSSGSGKSTILRVAAGLLAPVSGQILFQGIQVEGPPRGMQVVFQQYQQSLFPWLTVAGNVRLGLLQAGLSPTERDARVTHALDQVRLGDCANRLPGELSGGMAQRVAIARALAVRPALLCMDEPFGALDAVTRRALQDVLLGLPDRPTVLFVSHDVDEALYLADRIVVIRPRGRQGMKEIAPALPRPRNQIVTPSLPAWHRVRAELMGLLEETAP